MNYNSHILMQGLIKPASQVPIVTCVINHTKWPDTGEQKRQGATVEAARLRNRATAGAVRPEFRRSVRTDSMYGFR